MEYYRRMDIRRELPAGNIVRRNAPRNFAAES